VNSETKRTIVAVAAAVVIVAVAYGGIIAYSGTSSPFYTVESGSMSHTKGDRSQIGIIDTGDMVLAMDPSKMSITTYVEGHGSGYMRFGDYGDVIIYGRPSGTPVIHRAVLYVESNGDGTWNAEALTDYTGTWTVNDNPGTPADAAALAGELRFKDFGFNNTGDFKVDLDALAPVSGYITKGDANPGADQSTITSMNKLIDADSIIAIAAHEIPWMGAIKLYVTGNNTGAIPSNTLPSLIAVFALIFLSMITLGLVLERLERKNGKKD
jgi:signal peptidase